MTAPKIALEKLAKGEKVPKEFLELALQELTSSIELIQRTSSSICLDREPGIGK